MYLYLYVYVCASVYYICRQNLSPIWHINEEANKSLLSKSHKTLWHEISLLLTVRKGVYIEPIFLSNNCWQRVPVNFTEDTQLSRHSSALNKSMYFRCFRCGLFFFFSFWNVPVDQGDIFTPENYSKWTEKVFFQVKWSNLCGLQKSYMIHVSLAITGSRTEHEMKNM